MKAITFFKLGNRIPKNVKWYKMSAEEKEAHTAKTKIVEDEIKAFLLAIPNFEEEYNKYEHLFVEANEGEEIKYAFANKNYDDTNVEEGGHESIFVTTYGLIIGPNNNKDFTDYLEAAGLEEEECMGSFEQYLMEGDEVSKYKIEL